MDTYQHTLKYLLGKFSAVGVFNFLKLEKKS